ncbi:MAG TPA: cupin domain-containing protein [Stellaceae bacterium]|jgi:quercetin dioxygenase-like cupin family protein|nr:cupin domain-containing protein [Stellaceae bacterium]
MTRTSLSIGFALVALAPFGALADSQAMITQANNIKWAAAPPSLPKGAQIAVLSGDPGKEGPFVMRLKFPAGYKVPAHMHPADENATVISGTLNFAMGDKLDPKKGEALKPGSYFHMPKGMRHYAWATQETVVQVNGIGPWGITYVNAADDPRKTN